MKLLNRMSFHLGARYAFFAEQYLAAFVDVPLGARAGLEMNASGPYVNVALQPGSGSREVCIWVRWLLGRQGRGKRDEEWVFYDNPYGTLLGDARERGDHPCVRWSGLRNLAGDLETCRKSLDATNARGTSPR